MQGAVSEPPDSTVAGVFPSSISLSDGGGSTTYLSARVSDTLTKGVANLTLPGSDGNRAPGSVVNHLPTTGEDLNNQLLLGNHR